MEKTLIFIDEGYLSKISKKFGNGKHIKVNIFEFAATLAKEQNLWLESVYLYTASPFQDTHPTEDESFRMDRYKKFVYSLKQKSNIMVREGRLQKINDKFIQKGVDTLLTMDLLTEPFSKNIRTIIVLACDTDFVPILNSIRERGIRVILYFYNDFVRRSEFSMSNHILRASDKHVLLNKGHFEKSIFKD